MNKILQIILWSCTVIGVVVVLSFVEKSQENIIFNHNKIRINIDYETENRFVDEEGVKAYLVNSKDTSRKYLGDFDVLSIVKKIYGN